MDVFFRVGDRDLFLFRVVLEVVMIASGSRKVPTVLLQHLDDLPAAPTLGRTTTKSIPESMSYRGYRRFRLFQTVAERTQAPSSDGRVGGSVRRDSLNGE